MPLGIWDVSLADKTQDLQKTCLLQWHCLGGRSLDTSAGPRCVWPILRAEKENEWHFQTSQVSTPPSTGAMTAAAAWDHTYAQGKEFSNLCPAVTSRCRLSPARQKVLPRRTSADATNCRPCCRAPIAVTTLCGLSCQLTELCFKIWQVTLLLLSYVKGSFVNWSNPV